MIDNENLISISKVMECSKPWLKSTSKNRYTKNSSAAALIVHFLCDRDVGYTVRQQIDDNWILICLDYQPMWNGY